MAKHSFKFELIFIELSRKITPTLKHYYSQALFQAMGMQQCNEQNRRKPCPHTAYILVGEDRQQTSKYNIEYVRW